MSIPNMITLVRIVLTPVFVCLYLEGARPAAMLILAVAALSDMLDGAIARRYGLVTALGKVLDPVADKVLQLAMLLCLVPLGVGAGLLLLLHIVRELLLGLMGFAVYKRCGELIGARWYGKLCTGFMYTFLGLALLCPDMPEQLLQAGIYVCAGLVVYCLFRYSGEYLQLLRGGPIKKPG